ncbi:sugar phosphate nucleotidyltransferase [Variovorax sp. CCNWLW225]|uniref:sugar phosphate nucleotidyltransferase n=1 Tax=Variovorax sp. CCNWLW225 TaxID=3127462 RepID=UPI003077F2AE
MAGGKGTRLMPYTTVLPKPLMPLGDAPVLEYLLRKLHAHGVRRVCLAVNHLHHLIEAFFGDGRALGLSIEYAVENTPMGTCGPVSQVLDRMADRFLLLNGDLVTTLDFNEVAAQHLKREADATVSVLRRSMQIEYGVIDIDAESCITSIREKPRTDYLVSMGVYALTRDSLREFVVPGQALDMPDLLSAMMAAGRRVHAYEADCEWLDIGRPEDYARAQKMVSQQPASEVAS